MRFANAAHNPPLLWKSADQKIIKLDVDGFVLGLQKMLNIIVEKLSSMKMISALLY